MRDSIMRDSIPWGKLENPNAGKKELKKPKNREPLFSDQFRLGGSRGARLTEGIDDLPRYGKNLKNPFGKNRVKPVGKNEPFLNQLPWGASLGCKNPGASDVCASLKLLAGG